MGKKIKMCKGIFNFAIKFFMILNTKKKKKMVK